MTDPISVGLFTALLSSIGQDIAKAPIVGLSDRAFCSFAKQLVDRYLTAALVPENRDLERGLRIAQLQATSATLRSWHELLPEHDGGTNTFFDRYFAENALRLVDSHFRRVKSHNFSAADFTAINSFATTHLAPSSAQDYESSDRLKRLTRAAEDSCLSEISSAARGCAIPPAFEMIFRDGKSENGIEVIPPWRTRFAVYFAHRLNTNERFHLIWTELRLATLHDRLATFTERIDKRYTILSSSVRRIHDEVQELAEGLGPMAERLERVLAFTPGVDAERSFGYEYERARLQRLSKIGTETLIETDQLIASLSDRLHGRDDVVGRLCARFDGDSSITMLSGPGGIGKSALIAEVVRRSAAGGLFVARHFFSRRYRATTSEVDALRSLMKQMSAWCLCWTKSADICRRVLQ